MNQDLKLYESDKGDITLRDILSAIECLRDNYTLRVDTGKGFTDSVRHSISAFYTWTHDEFLPPVGSDGRGNLCFLSSKKIRRLITSKEEEPPFQIELLREGIKRYSGFPEIVHALSVLKTIAENEDAVRDVFRAHLTPSEVQCYAIALKFQEPSPAGSDAWDVVQKFDPNTVIEGPNKSRPLTPYQKLPVLVNKK